MREDRPGGTHAILAGLFFGGVMIGAEYLRENFDWRTHTWHELDNIPDGIRQIGGGEWETGFIVWPKSFDNPVDINQMILRHDQPYMLSTERRRWLRTATEKDIHDEWNKVQKISDSIDEIPGETNSDYAHRMSAIYNLKNQFWQMMLQWKIFQAKSTGEKYNALRAKSVITQIQEKCDKARRGVRGSHVGPDWGECLYVDLINAWLLEGEDASCWNKVANMKGIIDGHALEFQFGLATVDLPEIKDESGYYEEEPLKLFKVQNDFYSANGYVYAKVIGERPGYCYMPCSYEPPTYVVRVDASGKIVNWYQYPKRAKTLKEFLGSNDSPDDCIVAGLSKLNVVDLLSFHTNVSTMVACTNLGVAVARELKRRYDWIKVHEQPWGFDGCRLTLIHICDGDNDSYRCFDTVYDNEHNGDYPFAEIWARTYELSKHWGFSVWVSFRQGKKWIVDWEKSTAQQPVFAREKDK